MIVKIRRMFVLLLGVSEVFRWLGSEGCVGRLWESGLFGCLNVEITFNIIFILIFDWIGGVGCR